MSFGDYQQNYRMLHARFFESRPLLKPLVNSEYGYFLRDQSGDGVPDKDNSTSVESMRQATWDLVMAGGYVVTGFGTTYFGGNRDPGPFDLKAPKNAVWEEQIGHLKKFFTGLEWWRLMPRDDLVRCAIARGDDSRELNQIAPPRATYWCLAEPGRQYVIYVRGLTASVELADDAPARPIQARLFNPRTGEFKPLPIPTGPFRFQPPDAQDWVFLLN